MAVGPSLWPVDVVLWHFPVSHFNEKVRWALDWKGIRHERKVLTYDYLPRALLATGKPTLPILFIDGKAISDSTTIIETLEGLQPAPPLYPADRDTCRRALELEDFFDEELGPAVRTAMVGWAFYHDPKVAVRALATGMPDRARRLIESALPVFQSFYTWRHKIRPDNIDAARAKVAACLDRIESEIQPSGFLAGDRFSVADLTAAALLAPLVQPPDLEYKPDPLVVEALASYRDSIVSHTAAEWALGIFARYRYSASHAAA